MSDMTNHADEIRRRTVVMRETYVDQYQIRRMGESIDEHTSALEAERDAAVDQVALLQKTCWLALKVNADVTTKRESDPGYYANVEAMYAAVRECEAMGLLPPDDQATDGEVPS